MKCVEVFRREQSASASLLQLHLDIDNTRAVRMLAILEHRGIIGPAVGDEPREVFLRAQKP